MQDGISEPGRLRDDERVYLERVRLAAQVLLELVKRERINGVLETELELVRERAELGLLLPEYAGDLLPWRQVAAQFAADIVADAPEDDAPEDGTPS